MNARLPRWLTGLMAALCIIATASLAHAADRPRRVIAVGDLHGDHSAWLAIARDAGLIDPQGHWAGGKDVLVQMGDIADRGPGTLDIIASLKQLQAEAEAAGGAVIVLIGNHEAMNATGDNRYVTAAEYGAFVTPRSPAIRERYYLANRARIEAQARAAGGNLSPSAARERWLKATPLGWVEHEEAWGPNGAIGRWLAGNPAVARIGDTLFAHGGISSAMIGKSLEAINNETHMALKTKDTSPAAIINSPLGPLWYRGLVMRDADAEAMRQSSGIASPARGRELDEVLSAFGAKRMVIAHTPILSGVTILDGGKLVRVDTGISAYYDGKLGWLEILGDKLTPREAQRTP